MDDTSAMGRAVKALTPVMRGKTAYDPALVRDSADVMIMHAGDQMARLFPEGTGGKPSAALPVVWEDWEEFARLSEQSKRYAEGMKLGAENGLGRQQAEQGASMMGSGSMGENMMGSTAPMTIEMFATMPTDAAFAAVAQTCSVCHQKFRVKED